MLAKPLIYQQIIFSSARTGLAREMHIHRRAALSSLGTWGTGTWAVKTLSIWFAGTWKDDSPLPSKARSRTICKPAPIVTWFWTRPLTRWTDILAPSALPRLELLPALLDLSPR